MPRMPIPGLLLGLLAMLAASPVRAFCPDDAGIPAPATSTLPVGINLIAMPTSGPADLVGTFSLVVRDVCNDEIGLRAVILDFSACPDIQLSSTQGPGLVADCANRRILAVTDANGVVSGVLYGSVSDPAAGAVVACVHVLAENRPGESPTWVDLGSRDVAAYDLDGADGLGVGDFHRWLCDFDLALSPRRSDYDHSGFVGANDLSLWLTHYVQGTQAQSAPHCDGTPAATVLEANPGGLNLRWGECAAAGREIHAFSCVSNTGSDSLIGSIVATTGMDGLTSFQAIVEVRTLDGSALPDWWHVEPAPVGCRPGLTVANYFNLGASECLEDVAVAGMVSRLDVVSGAPDRALVRVLGASIASSVDLTPGEEYGLFNLRINHQRTVGAGACAGCATPVSIRFQSVEFTRTTCSGAAASPRVMADTPNWGSTVYFQGNATNSLWLEGEKPAKGGQGGKVTTTVLGANMDPGVEFRLQRLGESDIVGVTQSVNPNGLTAVVTFDLATAVLGLWDLRATNPDLETYVVSQAFRVEAQIPAHMVASQKLPARARFARTVDVPVTLSNLGNVDADGAGSFAVYVPVGISPVTMSYAGTPIGSYTPVVQGARALVGVFTAPPEKFSQRSEAWHYRFTAPSVALCETYTVQLHHVPMQLPGPPVEPEAPAAVALEEVRLGVEGAGETWPSLSSGFLAAARTQFQSELLGRVEAFRANPSSNVAFGDYGELLGAAFDAVLASLSSSYASDVADVHTAWDPVRTNSTTWAAFKAAMPAVRATIGVPPAPVADYPGPPVSGTLCYLASYDPNDKLGPPGPGVEHFVKDEAPMEYVIHFENLATASAAAQTVVVTDQLDPLQMNLPTLELGRFTFGPYSVEPPPGQTSYTADVDLRPTQNLIARVSGSVSLITGQIAWRFSSLDPSTMAPTTDVVAGLLPPNTSPPQGEGTVAFRVSRVPGLPSGTMISNQARIVFDENPYIDTPVWTNTLDRDPPSSAVQSLPADAESLTFTVHWAGADAGAGVLDYDVHVSTDGGPWQVWLHNTTQTAAPFTGVGGHTYGFYSVARDRVGNVESAPEGADTRTAMTLGGGMPVAPRELALSRVGANPTASALVFEVALPVAAPGRLELLDLGGRRLDTVDLGPLGVGRHTLRLGTQRALPAGVYLVRASQAGQSRTVKAAVLR